VRNRVRPGGREGGFELEGILGQVLGELDFDYFWRSTWLAAAKQGVRRVVPGLGPVQIVDLERMVVDPLYGGVEIAGDEEVSLSERLAEKTVLVLEAGVLPRYSEIATASPAALEVLGIALLCPRHF
jgi:hypothetical protein